MEMIHFQGLNCYHDSVVSIANHLGIDYAAAFGNLWSETDFRYDPYREVYLSKRMIENLEILGVRVRSFECPSSEDVSRELALSEAREWMIMGMNAFAIPWNPFYQRFHGPHYFVIQNGSKETLLSFDPTYAVGNQQIPREALIAHGFDICRVRRAAKGATLAGIQQEAENILRTHQSTCETLSERIRGLKGSAEKEILLSANYIGTMICNRYLFRFFLKREMKKEKTLGQGELPFLSDDQFFQWIAVKNGLYKAAANRNQEAVLEEVCGLLSGLLAEEMKLAEEMAGLSRL